MKHQVYRHGDTEVVLESEAKCSEDGKITHWNVRRVSGPIDNVEFGERYVVPTRKLAPVRRVCIGPDL